LANLNSLSGKFQKGDIKSCVSIFDSINYLNIAGLLTEKEKNNLLVASSTIMLLRSESLVYNKGTPLSNLSFLNLDDDSFFKSSTLVNTLFSSAAELRSNFLISQNTIAATKAMLVRAALEAHLPKTIYQKITMLETKPIDKETVKDFLVDDSLLIKVSTIWKIAKTRMYNYMQTEILDMIENRTLSWEEMASLASIPELGAKEITIIANKIMNIPEFDYILRIIAQHSNTPRSVLEAVCSKKKDPRYTLLAKIALSGKREETNFQV